VGRENVRSLTRDHLELERSNVGVLRATLKASDLWTGIMVAMVTHGPQGYMAFAPARQADCERPILPVDCTRAQLPVALAF
jgi:hypothetical protein